MKKNKTVIRSGVRKNKGFAKAKRCQAATLTAQQRWLGLRPRQCKLFATQISGWPASVASSAPGNIKRPFKLRIKNTAYLGETGRKVELSKRRKIITPARLLSYTGRASGQVRKCSRRALLMGKPLAQPKLSNNFKKYSLYFKKKTWYTDKAAPIPGGNQKLSTGFARKEKFYKKIFRAYRLFKTYMNFNKKALKKLCIKSSLNKDMTEFASIMHMDSLFYCSMRKSCLRLCKTTEALPQVISRSPYFLNGKYVTKKNFVLYRTNKVLTHRALGLKDGDFCIMSLRTALRTASSPQSGEVRFAVKRMH